MPDKTIDQSGEGNVYVGGNVIGDIRISNKFYQAIPSIAPALRQLPPPPLHFTGRKAEIERLVQKLEHRGVSILGLQGQGGVGKTALALVLANKLKRLYPNQIVLELNGVSPQPLTLAQAMTSVIHAYEPKYQPPDSETEIRGKYFTVLEKERVLFLMDNARDAEQIEPLIPHSECLLIVTSRHYFELHGAPPYRLDVLLPEDARELLLTVTPRIGADVDKLAKLCGYLPYALRLAASYLAKRPDFRPAEYIRQLADDEKRLGLIEAVLGLSYELLDENQKKLWRMLAAGSWPGITVNSAAAIWGMRDKPNLSLIQRLFRLPDNSKLRVEDAQVILSDLVRRSLIEWREGDGAYQMHDLAQVFARSRLSEDERLEANKGVAKYLLELWRDAENKLNSSLKEFSRKSAAEKPKFDADCYSFSLWLSNVRSATEEVKSLPWITSVLCFSTWANWSKALSTENKL